MIAISLHAKTSQSGNIGKKKIAKSKMILDSNFSIEVQKNYVPCKLQQQTVS